MRWLCLAAVLLGTGGDPCRGQDVDSATALAFEDLRFRHIGPLGNRVIAVVGQPGEPGTYYVGAASGGVFKSADGGHSWQPTFDDQPASSIGALAIAPSDPSVVWVGTGETFIRANISIGNGVYVSTDGGESWEHRGLDATGRIGRIVVHPDDPDIAWACALGHTYGPQPERGVFRTRDQGRTWEHVLFVDPDTGCSDLALNPRNPRRLMAGMWQIEVATWGRTSGGPGSGLYLSRDGGDTWERLEGEGLPTGPLGKIGLGIAASDPDRVYALIETSSNADFAPADPFQGVLWRSDDGARSWEMVNGSNDLTARPLYYSRLTISPRDADEVYFNAPGHFRSLDGGRTHERSSPQPGYDHHDMWIDPADPDRMIVGHDGGVSISTNGGETWYQPQLPIAQMYHAHVDDRIPYFVYGNRQDGPSTRGPSNSLTGGRIPIGEWRSVGGCEVGFAVPDTVDDRTVWTGCYDGILTRHDLESGHTRNVSVWPVAIESWPAEDLRYRWQWTYPIEISPHDHRRVYVGSQHVHMTENGGQSWRVISPDLTTDDPVLQGRMGGLTLDDAGPTIAPVVFAIAESPLERGLIWAGTNDGLVHVTRDGGTSWTDVTGALPDLAPLGTISNIQPSRHDPGTAYLTVDRHQLGDFDPYIYRTDDYGETWRRIDNGIRRSVFSFTHVVREDPEQPGLLFAGTENAIWVSFDDGVSWRELRSNLPHVPVHWLAIQEHFADLVVATYGRGFWILDDITPLRELARRQQAGATGDALFQPRPAYRFRSVGSPMSQPGDPAAGENPPYGASLHYFLDAPATETPRIYILNAAGDTVASLSGPDDPGLHRVHWNLRGPSTREIELRTPPAGNPHVPLPDRGWRAMPDGGRLSILQPPGTYAVVLAIGEERHSASLTILRDPASSGDEVDVAAQMRLLDDLTDQANRAADLINRAEVLRVWLANVARSVEAAERNVDPRMLERADSLSAAIAEIESEMFDLRHTGEGQDGLRWRRLLYARITSLARGINSSDNAPTDQAVEVAAMLGEQLADVEGRFDALRAGPLREYVDDLAALELTGIVLPAASDLLP